MSTFNFIEIDNNIYELSLWDDTVINGNPAEKKKCIIASNTMSSPAKAFNITLNKKTNGEKTLNFSICAKYYDQEIEDFVTNPYLSLLTNERKVKLRKKEKGEVKWYDFIIKQVAEDSSNQTYTYTAKDQHIQELAKSGFELEFDKELQNNTGTKEELAERILKGSGWGVSKEELLEYTKEPVYRAFLQYNNGEKKIQLDSLRPPTEETETNKNRWPSIELTNQDCVYILYSESNSEADKIQVLFYKDYVFDEKTGEFVFSPVLNDENILLRDKYRNYWVSKTNIATKTLQPGIQGERLVQSQKMVYDKALEQYVKIYKDSQGKEVHGFTRTEYNTPELVENLITNGEGDFIDTSGWYNTDTGTRSLVFQPDVQEWTDKVEPESFIEAKQEPGLSGLWSIVNTGLFDNRTKLQGFSKDQPYFFEWEFASIQRWQTEELRQVVICDYEFESGKYKQKEGGEVYFEKTRGMTPLQSPLSLSCKKTVSNEELKKKKIGIFLVFMGHGNEKDPVYVRIKNCKFYRDIGVKPGSISTLDPDDLIKTHYYYYDPDSNYTKFEDIKFLYEGYEEQSAYEPFYEGYEKKRTITGKESNRYNLLQEICEQFECWLRLDIEHDTNGKVLSKAVSFHEYVGKDNRAGFKYGINLKSIKRNVDSNQIVTKMITKDNSNEFAKNGFCSIARAPSNPSGTNVIYNFDYYIGQDLLDADEVSKALYAYSNDFNEDEDDNGIDKLDFPDNWGLYSKLNYITSKTQAITEEQIGISKNLTSLKASIDVEQAKLDGAESSLVELEEDLERLTGHGYDEILAHDVGEDYDKWNWKDTSEVNSYKVKIRHLRKEKENAEKTLGGLLEPSYDNSYVATYSEDDKKLEISNYIGVGTNSKVFYFSNYQSNKDININIVNPEGFTWYVTDSYRGPAIYSIDNSGTTKNLILPKNKTLIIVTQYLEIVLGNGLLFNKKEFQDKYDLNTKKLEFYNEQRKKIEQEFYQKYARFIQEGSWISEDYIDDELYYLDALATGYTSSRPKVSYTIDVFDLASIEGYENYEFQIGDKTFVQDPEFFGYKTETIVDPQNSERTYTIKVPIREEVVVNEMTEGIDDITKNAIKVQNYKTQFDDLFQRIAATTESLQYNTGRYERGAKAVEPDGSISHKALQQTVTENGLAIANAGAQTVTINEQGVVTTDKTLPNKKVRIIGGGIYVTKDGGETWETGITGDGINANVITTGQLNAGEINIMTGDAPSHRWDSKGITAYDTTYDFSTGEIKSVSNSNFVRFDEFGIYGIQNNPNFDARQADTKATLDPLANKEEIRHGTSKIRRDSIFSLTKDGLTIGKEGYGLIATDEGVTIGPGGVMKMGYNEFNKRHEISIGDGFVGYDGGLDIAGWEVRDKSLAYGRSKDPSDQSYPNGTLFISPAGLEEKDISGETDSGGLIKSTKYSIYSNGNFGVTSDGELHAQGAWIGGHVEADSGYIGGISFDNGGINAETSEDIAEDNIAEWILPKIRDVKHSTTVNTNNKTIIITKWTNGTRTVHYYLAKESISIDIATQADRNGTIIAILSSLPEGESIYDCVELLYTSEAESNSILIQKNQYLMISSPVGKEATYVATKGQNFSKNYNFSITPSGLITAQNAVIIGDIEASTLTANWGNIAGWKITPTALYYGEPGETNYFCLATPAAQSLPSGYSLLAARATTAAETATNALTIGKQFSVKSNGALMASGATIQGSVTITGALGAGTGSSIGGWSFDNNKFYQGENIFLSASGEEKDSIVENGVAATYTIWSKGNFGITKDGFIHAKNANIQGTIYATNGKFSGDISGSTGTIGQWTFGERFGVKGFYSDQAVNSDGLAQSTIIFSPKNGLGIYQGNGSTGEGAYDWISWHKLISLK